MDYITSQYSVIEENILYADWVDILRPDGVTIAKFAHVDKSAAYAVCDELNSLLVLPNPPIVIRDVWTPEQHAIEDAKTLDYILSVLVPSKDEISEDEDE